jgi:hypothetical protein
MLSAEAIKRMPLPAAALKESAAAGRRKAIERER